MTKFSSLTLSALLLSALALPAMAQGTAHTAMRPVAKHRVVKAPVHKIAATATDTVRTPAVTSAPITAPATGTTVSKPGATLAAPASQPHRAGP